MKTLFKILILVSFSAILSCSEKTPGLYNDQYDIYIAGLEYNYDKDVWAAALWKNGIKQPIDISENEPSSIFTIAVSGNDVYAVGEIQNNHVVWKNGIRFFTLPYEHYIYSMVVSGDNVYIVGDRKASPTYVATLWKNGEIQELEGCVDESTAMSVAVSGNDVYVAGKNGDVATLWKNGKQQQLETASGSIANGVAVNGNDVFVLGKDNHECTIWKNGKKYMNIHSENRNSNIGTITVTDKDIYVTGTTTHPITTSFIITTGTIWKNGVELSFDHNPNMYSSIKSMSIYGNDLYAIGNEIEIMDNDTKDTPTLWRNGVKIPIGINSKTYQAYSIVVVKK